MNISKDEAEELADAIVLNLYHQMDSQFRVMLKRVIIKHLSPPPKLEWEYPTTGVWIVPHQYRIAVNEDGRFQAERYESGHRTFCSVLPTLAEAKAAAQSHAEAADA